MKQPEFIIVGAMRAGTTALAAALDKHHEVAVSRPKEPNYFSTLHGALEFKGPGDQWFASQNIADRTSYFGLFPSSPRVTGEASAMYLALPKTALSIAEELPHVKIIMILRDPLERARSAHSYLRVKGREKKRTFLSGLRAEKTRREQGYGPMWWYSDASNYSSAISAYLQAFDRNRVFITTSEELKGSPTATVGSLLDFLDLPESSAPLQFLSSSNVNAGGVPRSETLTRILYPPDSLRSFARRFTPERGREVVRIARRSMVEGLPQTREDLDPGTRASFCRMAEATCEVIDRDLSHLWASMQERE